MEPRVCEAAEMQHGFPRLQQLTHPLHGLQDLERYLKYELLLGFAHYDRSSFSLRAKSRRYLLYLRGKETHGSSRSVVEPPA